MEYFRQRYIDELNDEGDIEVRGQTWSRYQVLETMDKQAEAAVFQDWVGEAKIQAKARAREFLIEYGVLERFNAMMARHGNGSILPFVGAGMSIASGYPFWGKFILNILSDRQSALPEVKELLNAAKYEEAGQCAHDALGAGNLAEEIHNHMGRHKGQDSGPVCLMPELFQAEVLTTNFDYVLNHVYRNSDNPFIREFAGTQLGQAAQRLGNDPHCLLRLHGEGDTPENRVLTLQEYEAVYSEGEGLHGTLGRIIGHQSMLFTGCSLQTDRTFEAFCKLKQAANGEATRHYAFLPYLGDDEREARREFLGQAEIHPIYYRPEDHDQSIEDLFITMMEGGFDD